MAGQPQAKRLYRFGPFSVNPSERLLLHEDAPIALTPKAFDLLVLLVVNAGHLLEKDVLMRELWSDTFVEEANLSNNVSLLRKALGEGEGGAKYIETVPKRGYRFLAVVEEVDESRNAGGEALLAVLPEQQIDAAATTDGPVQLFGRKGTKQLIWPLAVLLGGVAVAITIRRFGNPTPAPRAVRFVVAPPTGTSLPPQAAPISPVISPDGARLAFHVVRGGEQFLAIRSLDALQARVLEGTVGGRFPFWSPDGRVIAFFAGGKLKKISVSGGPIQTICEAGLGFGGTWNRGGQIVFAPSETEGLFQVPAGGGQPSALTSLREGERYHLTPQFLPDGRRFLYFAWPDAVYLGSLDGGAPTRVLTSSRMALYSPPGYLLFAQGPESCMPAAGCALLAQRFDADRRTLIGDPAAIGEGLGIARPGAAGLSVSDTGVLAYAMSPPVNVALAWVDRTGQPRGAVEPFPFGVYANVELSPDGTQIALESPAGGGNSDRNIWLFELSQRRASQVTFGAPADHRPIWSPDGRALMFVSARREDPGIYQRPAGGEKPEELLLRSERSGERELPRPSDWSSKGIVYEIPAHDARTTDVRMLPLGGDDKPYPLVRVEGFQNDAKVSPDAKWLAFTSDEAGRPEVSVQSISTADTKWRISTAGGSLPRWRRDGKELFYLGADGKLMAVAVGSDATTFRPGVPQQLFQTALTSMGRARRSFSVTPDGQRFLISVSEDAGTPRSVVVVSNWQAALKP